MNNQLDNAYNYFFGYIDKKRNDAIRNYINERDSVYNRTKLKHEKFWKKKW